MMSISWVVSSAVARLLNSSGTDPICAPQSVQIGQLLPVPGGGQKAVAAVAVIPPVGGHHPGDHIAAGKQAEDVAPGPAAAQGAPGGVVGVEVLLQVGPVGGGQGRRGGKAVGKEVLLPELRQFLADLGGKEICHDGSPAVPAQPELDLAAAADGA